jgi:hypothetical protein
MSQQAPSATSLEDSIAQFLVGVAKHAPPEQLLAKVNSEVRKLADSGIAAQVTNFLCMPGPYLRVHGAFEIGSSTARTLAAATFSMAAPYSPRRAARLHRAR